MNFQFDLTAEQTKFLAEIARARGVDPGELMRVWVSDKLKEAVAVRANEEAEADIVSMNQDVNYPEVVVQLTGENGNTLAIMGRVTAALRKHGVSNEEILRFQDEILSDDYNHALNTVHTWVTVR